jgi:hypothetical protein
MTKVGPLPVGPDRRHKTAEARKINDDRVSVENDLKEAKANAYDVLDAETAAIWADDPEQPRHHA